MVFHLTKIQSLHFFFISADPHSFWSLSAIATPSKSLSVPHCPGTLLPRPQCSVPVRDVPQEACWSALDFSFQASYFLKWGGHSETLTLHALDWTLLVLAFSTLIPSCSCMCENIFDSLYLDNLPMSLVFGLKSFYGKNSFHRVGSHFTAGF